MSAVAIIAIAAALVASVVAAQTGTPKQVTLPDAAATSKAKVADGSVTLEPPPSDVRPRLDADQAIELARAEAPGFVADATEVRPVFGLYSRATPTAEGGNPVYDHVPAWIVTLKGVCIPFFGGRGEGTEGNDNTPQCAGTELNVVIEDATGAIIEDFSYQ